MTPLGYNILVEPKPREKMRGLIIIPDTVTPPNQEWGVVLAGNEEITTGSRVLYFGKQLFTKDNKKFLPVRKVLIWE